MGIIPTPTEYGQNCSRCYPAGRTPKMFKVFVSGVKCGAKCDSNDPSPPNGYFDAEQKDANPCRYLSPPYNGWICALEFQSGRTWFEVSHICEYNAFLSIPNVECVTAFENAYNDPRYVRYYGGYAHCTPVEPLTNVVSSVTPLFDPDPRLECFVPNASQIVIRYAGKRDATRLYLKLDL